MRFLEKRGVLVPLLTLVFLASSVGCARQSDANHAGSFPFANVQAACGPTDGPAREFYFTSKQSHDGKYEEPYLVILVSENLPKSAPQSYSIKSESWAVQALRCQKPGQCDAATSGSLHLAKFSPTNGVSGDYELHFQDGSAEKGSFDATWYFVKNLICG
jgi:hypothetical protein